MCVGDVDTRQIGWLSRDAVVLLGTLTKFINIHFIILGNLVTSHKTPQHTTRHTVRKERFKARKALLGHVEILISERCVSKQHARTVTIQERCAGALCKAFTAVDRFG